MAHSDTTALFTEALNVLNAVLSEHRDSAPFETLLRASEKVLGDRPIGVAVYESDASAPFDYFTIRLRDGVFELVSHGKQDPDVAWRVSRAYLEKLTRNPEDYFDNPLKLDWDWLKSRVGIED